IHSCWTDSNNHSPALMKINTGMTRMGFPCVGSWVTYGLGTESQNLPAFVVMYDTLGRGLPKGYAQNWGAGFLPSIYQGTALKPQGAPIENLYRAADMTDQQQRAQLDLLGRLNRRHLSPPLAGASGSRAAPREAPDRAARSESCGRAYRTHPAAPGALDFKQKPPPPPRLYGVNTPGATHSARQCLMARRLVERGVRF